MGRAGKKAARLAGAGIGGLTSGAERPDGDPPSLALSEFDADAPEESYRRAVPFEHRRRWGQFFTPPAIADLMCRWVAAKGPKTLLDPAVGPGIFLRAFRRRTDKCRLTAIDVDETALEACRRAIGSSGPITLLREDFLTWSSDAQFDAILANPPYLRHHDMLYDLDIFREIGRRNGVRLSRLTNAYGLFLLETCRRLSPGGRASVIIPGEWLNANFGMPLKGFLLENGLLRLLVYYSHASIVFEDALTTACLLFIEKSPGKTAPDKLRTVFVDGDVSPGVLRPALEGKMIRDGKVIERTIAMDVLRREAKWNHLLEHGEDERLPGFVPLSALAGSCRGIATGANRFFHLSDEDFREHGLSPRHRRPCIGRAASVRGFIFEGKDFERLVESGQRCHLMVFAGDLSERDRSYLRMGEREGLPERYLLAGRSPWYSMEERRPAPIWAAVFGRGQLRFIWNAAGILNLTTFHCIYPTLERPNLTPALIACLNSDFVQELARRHHRVYGGGLRKFEPRDLLEIQVPDLAAVSENTLAELADLLTGLHVAAGRARDAEAKVHRRLNRLISAAVEEIGTVAASP
ncbi:MAG: SAM-dependent DNA methyltransferase [Phycisphaerales bacterium]|nr:MAG: SAM-dependent DNA methyltransferase [Phycisphaerales bacterium]